MPDRELVLRERCKHGRFGDCPSYLPRSRPGVDSPCPGGSETVLDPERVLGFRQPYLPAEPLTVQDILDALGGSES